MRRRNFLTAVGAGALGGLAGCLGDSRDGASSDPTTDEPTTEVPSGEAPFEHPGTLDETFATNGEFPPDEDPADGRPPAFSDQPEAPDVDVSSFETTEANGETVRLAPVEVVEAWYRRGEARIVDARGLSQYTRAHVYGAVFSAAQRGSTGGAIEGWPTDERVVTYCNCPHHLSSVRAAGLQKAGFEEVYAIDEGFAREDGWADHGYPMAGREFREGTRESVSTWSIAGTVDPSLAGEYVWAAAGNQYEAAPVREDGSYELVAHFAGVDATTPVDLATPEETVRRPLGEVGKLADAPA